METVDGFFEVGAHLDFVDEEKVLEAGLIMFFDVVVEGVVFLERFKVDVVEVDMDDVGVGDFASNVFLEGLKQDRLTAAANAGDDLDVGAVHDFFEGFEITALNDFHDIIIA